MAHQLQLFMLPDDERAFLRALEIHHLEVYPRRVPPDWKPFRATPAAYEQLPEEDVYLAASEIGNVLVDVVKRGPDKGSWRVDEIRSPVIFWERSVKNDDGELLSGQLWAELEITAQTGRRDPAPDRFRKLYLTVEEWLVKSFRKSNPKGWLIGPAAARAHKEEKLVLRDNEFRGREVTVWK
jgi:hypothetical protein